MPQTFNHFTVPMTTGTPVSAASVLPPDILAQAAQGNTVITLQPHSGNAAVVYVGGSNVTLSSSNYAFRLEIPVTSIPQAPFMFETTRIDLRDLFFLGTTNDEVQMGIAPA